MPMKDEEGRYHLVYNGEIYNFRELRKIWKNVIASFPNSDTEVILRLFSEKREEHGPFEWNVCCRTL